MGIRREWLGHGLSTLPADREAAERSLARIYARISRPRPRFVWVDSPLQAMPLVSGLPTLDDLHAWVMAEVPAAAPPAGDVAMSVSRLRARLDGSRPEPEPPRREGLKKAVWTIWPAQQALAAGVPLVDMLRRGVWEALAASLADGFHRPVRAALPAGLPVVWYGQQDSSWIAYYDVLRRLGLATFPASDEEHLDDWATLARASGWWWPGETTCVVVERPATVDTEAAPGALHEEVRAVRVAYRDGWSPQTFFQKPEAQLTVGAPATVPPRGHPGAGRRQDDGARRRGSAPAAVAA